MGNKKAISWPAAAEPVALVLAVWLATVIIYLLEVLLLRLLLLWGNVVEVINPILLVIASNASISPERNAAMF
jgi:hypothetical protein